jgi:hypothetical protein
MTKWSTIPVVKSLKVVKLAKAGYTSKLLDAIKNERKGTSSSGSSVDGKITVTRVGTYAYKK